MNSPTDRTRLAWRRTVLAMLSAGLLGAIHLALAGFEVLAVLVGVAGVLGCLPALFRSAQLRSPGEPVVATWEPLAVSAAALLLGSAVLVWR